MLDVGVSQMGLGFGPGCSKGPCNHASVGNQLPLKKLLYGQFGCRYFEDKP